MSPATIRYLGAASLLTLLFAGSLSAQDERRIRALEPGKPIERQIAAGETHTYSLRLETSDFVHVFVYQRGVNVAATLVGPDGKKLLEADSPMTMQEAEWITHVASAAGEYKIEVRVVDKAAPPGRYEISEEELRKSVPGDEPRLSAQRLLAEAKSLYDENNADSYRKAIEKYGKALESYRQAGRLREEALTLNCAARAYTFLSDYKAALENFHSALSIYQKLADVHGEGITLHGIGFVHTLEGRYDEAIKYYEEALIARRRVGYLAGEGRTLGNLGGVCYRLNRFETAIEYLEQALTILREVKDRAAETGALGNLGLAYYSLRRYEKAIEYYDQDLAVRRELKDQAGECNALDNLGNAYYGLGRYEKAIEYYDPELVLRRELKDRAGESNVLGNLALAYYTKKRYEKAIEYYDQALSVRREVKDRAGEGTALASLGDSYYGLRRYEKAIEYYEQALAVRRELKDRAGEGNSLSSLGNAYFSLSRFEKAIEYHDQALAIRREVKDQASEGNTLNSLGEAYASLSRYEKAVSYFELALSIARAGNNRAGESRALMNLGDAYNLLSRYEKAIGYYEQALPIEQSLKDQPGEGRTFDSLGSTYMRLSRYEKAIEYHGQALAIAREIKHRELEGNALSNLGNAYMTLSRYEKAVDYYEQGLAAIREVNNRAKEGDALNNLGVAYFNLGRYEKAVEHYLQSLSIAREVKNRLSEGNELANLGNVFYVLRQYEKMLEYYEQALAKLREVKNRQGEGVQLSNLGYAHYLLSHYEKATEFYEQALAIEREVKDQASEGRTLANLMLLQQKQNNNRLAVFYGKQAINAYQEIRGNFKTLDRESRQSFLKDKEGSYRTLANLLISEARLPEAEQVLALLKEEEYSKIVRRDGPLSAGIGFNKTESEGAKASAQLAVLARERGAIQARLDSKTVNDEDRRRMDEIDNRMAQTNREFRRVMAEIAKSPPADTRGLEAVQQSQALMPDLRSLGQGTVALYTVVTKEKGWIMMVTPDSRKAYRIDTDGLEQTVAQLRETLKDDRFDPVPLAQKLYRMIMEAPQDSGPTLAQDLRAYGARTLMWSLDGVLRYVPVTALHDGKDYLVSSYINVVFTTASISRLNKAVSAHWRGLGLGVSKQYGDFPALPGVEHELQSIFSDEAGKKQTGVLAGQIMMNEAFNKRSMLDGLREGFSVVHIASHFSFDTANEEKSFLLLGDGNGLTLEELQDYQNIFEKVELLTLSACDTAVGGANGKEVEGLAYLAQILGANAVVASLWPVADVGAEALMREFYYLRTKYPALSKAEDFQRAQLALLRGEAKSLNARENDERNRSPHVMAGDRSKGLLPYKKNPSAPFAHPHYWAPFILIGNWK